MQRHRVPDVVGIVKTESFLDAEEVRDGVVVIRLREEMGRVGEMRMILTSVAVCRGPSRRGFQVLVALPVRRGVKNGGDPELDLLPWLSVRIGGSPAMRCFRENVG
jgi:hypothetical protein